MIEIHPKLTDKLCVGIKSIITTDYWDLCQIYTSRKLKYEIALRQRLNKTCNLNQPDGWHEWLDMSNEEFKLPQGIIRWREIYDQNMAEMKRIIGVEMSDFTDSPQERISPSNGYNLVLNCLKKAAKNTNWELEKKTGWPKKPTLEFLIGGEEKLKFPSQKCGIMFESGLNIIVSEIKLFRNLKEEGELYICESGKTSDSPFGEEKQREMDLYFKNKLTNVFFYKEVKANPDLDSEKMPATINKILDIQSYIQKAYPECNIDIGVQFVYWEEKDGSGYKSKFSTIRESGIPTHFMKDFFSLLQIDITKEEWYALCRQIGKECILPYIK